MPFCRITDLGSAMIHLITLKWTKNSQISKSLHASLYISSIFKYRSQCTACSEGVQVLRFHFLTFTSRNPDLLILILKYIETHWYLSWMFHIPSVRSTEANEAWCRSHSKFGTCSLATAATLPSTRRSRFSASASLPRSCSKLPKWPYARNDS